MESSRSVTETLSSLASTRIPTYANEGEGLFFRTNQSQMNGAASPQKIKKNKQNMKTDLDFTRISLVR